MDYLSIDAAKKRPGETFLVLTAGVPGPWGESAKALFHVKGLSYTPVAQEGGGENAELREWTGHDNAPIAIHRDEMPRTGWAEILFLVERLATEPALIPADPAERALMLGLCHEICGEGGLGWTRRLMLLESVLCVPELADSPVGDPVRRLGAKYGYDPGAAAGAPERVAEVLRMLSGRLLAQHDSGSRFFVGDRLSALDLYWAAFAALVSPLPEADCPMAEFMRAQYTLPDGALRAAVDPILLDHRDAIYRDFLQLPLDF